MNEVTRWFKPKALDNKSSQKSSNDESLIDGLSDISKNDKEEDESKVDFNEI